MGDRRVLTAGSQPPVRLAPVDGGDEGFVGNNFVQKSGEGVLQVAEGELLKNPEKGRVAGHAVRSFSESKPKKLLELRQMKFGPTFDFGERGTMGEEPKKEEGENGTQGLGLALLGSRIGYIFEAMGENFEGIGRGHWQPPCVKTSRKLFASRSSTQEIAARMKISVKLEDGVPGD